MELVSLKVYEGNNIKGKKRIIKVTITSSSDREIKLYLKAYFRVSFLLGFKEKLIGLEINNQEYNLWISYTQEDVSKYILRNLIYDFENIEKLTERANSLVKESFLLKVKERALKIGMPVIEITETMFQLGYGKNSVIVGDKYQSYEDIEKVEISRDREKLWQALQYNHIPKAYGKIIYCIDETEDSRQLEYPITIRGIDKTKDITISTQSKEEFNKVLANMMKTYTRVFIFSGMIHYRVICYKGECGLVFVHNHLCESSEIPESIKEFCRKVYKSFPIEFMYIDLQNGETEGLRVADLGCVFDIECIVQSVQSTLAEYFIDCMKKNGIGNIPIITISGTNGKTTTARLIYLILSKLGFAAGLTSSGGVFVGDKKIKHGDTTGFLSARAVLTSKEAEIGVFETARGGIYRNGLGYENAKVAVITSLSEDHIGMPGISNLEDLANIKAVIFDELCEDGKIVIKAQRELIDIAIKRKSTRNICLIAPKRDNLVEEHIRSGGEVFFLENSFIIHCINGVEKKIINAKDIPFTHGGISIGNIQNIMSALASVATIYGDMDKILKVLKEIECDLYCNAGRQNILDFHEFRVVLDYGHNAEAFTEVFNIATSLKPSKITAIIAAAGDRMDKYIIELGEISAEFCDKIIIREQADLRGRNVGESASLIHIGVNNKGFDENNLSIIYKEEDAIINAMENAEEGEVIVLFTQCLDVIMPAINQYLKRKNMQLIGEGIDFSH